jgi:cysteine desulfuration protein SufE
LFAHVKAMSATSLTETVDEIAADFDLLADGDEQLSYVIELGKKLAPLSQDERIDANKVRGCASQVWLVTEQAPDGRLRYRGDSDAIIVRGLVGVVLRIFSDRTPAEILGADANAIFARLKLTQMLTPQRSNGLFSMIQRIRTDAQKAAAASA